MKKLCLILSFLTSSAFVFADNNRVNKVACVAYDQVKMYRQASTSTEELHSLKTTDELIVKRKHNAYWTIVLLNGQAGYVLTSELQQPKEIKKPLFAKVSNRR